MSTAAPPVPPAPLPIIRPVRAGIYLLVAFIVFLALALVIFIAFAFATPDADYEKPARRVYYPNFAPVEAAGEEPPRPAVRSLFPTLADVPTTVDYGYAYPADAVTGDRIIGGPYGLYAAT